MALLRLGRFVTDPAGTGDMRLGWPARYEIRADSILDDRWAEWFGGLQLSHDGTQTVIMGVFADQPAVPQLPLT